MHWRKVFPFIIRIRPPFNYENLVPWTKQALLSIRCSTKMTVTEAAERSNFWDTTPIATIEGLAAGVDISIPITTLAQEAPQSQLGHATIDRAAAMSIFQPVLNDVTRIAIVKVELGSVRYETGNVAAYKANDTFSICMFGPQYMTNVSLIHKTPSEGPRCDWPDSPQVVTRSDQYLLTCRARSGLCCLAKEECTSRMVSISPDSVSFVRRAHYQGLVQFPCEMMVTTPRLDSRLGNYLIMRNL